ncbi:MAG: hypothetical protein WC878_05930 [Candidatus Paceibacterota bacterium]|jgi:hypothetical protein
MYWNYRVVHKVEKGEESFAIHEAFYDSGKEHPHSITMNGIAPYGGSIEELHSDMENMMKAFDKPVLEYSDF